MEANFDITIKAEKIGDKELQRIGNQLAAGILHRIGFYFIIGCALVTTFAAIKNAFDFGLDDSDKSSYQRSGLQVHTDHKTGVQYLSDGKGGFFARLDENGKVVINYNKNKVE